MMRFVLAGIFVLITCGPASGQQIGPTLKQSIQGIWWSPDLFQSAAFQIKDSTIFYPDTFDELRYEVHGASLMVFHEDGVAVSTIVRATPDTLVLFSFGQRAIYTRSETKPPKGNNK